MRTVFLSHRRAEHAEADAIRHRIGDRWRVLTLDARPGSREAWREAFRSLIETADAVVCVVGPSTAESPHVEWELETAFELGLPVVAVAGPTAKAPPLPRPLADRGTMLIGPSELVARLEDVAYERTS